MIAIYEGARASWQTEKFRSPITALEITDGRLENFSMLCHGGSS